MSEIRNCSRADLPAVAALFQHTFRNPARAAPASLAAYLAAAYLDHPWFDPDIAARVHVNDAGRVTGFVGVFPGRFELDGRLFRAAIAGSLMVEQPGREPLAGAKLLRSVVRGPQDISISETANLVSQRLWEPLGGKAAPILSLDWFRVFSPGVAALSMLAEARPAAALLAPAARLADFVGRSWTRGLATSAPAGRFEVDIAPSDAMLAAAIIELGRSIDLHPAWSETDLGWLLRHAASKERYGPVHRGVVRHRKGGLVGCYIYHGKRGGTGRVLQALARPDAADVVVDSLFSEAEKSGLSGLRGRCTAQLMNALLIRNCIFLHRASTMFHTENEALTQALRAGEAFVTGLAGESWTRLVGGEFS